MQLKLHFPGYNPLLTSVKNAPLSAFTKPLPGIYSNYSNLAVDVILQYVKCERSLLRS